MEITYFEAFGRLKIDNTTNLAVELKSFAKFECSKLSRSTNCLKKKYCFTAPGVKFDELSNYGKKNNSFLTIF